MADPYGFGSWNRPQIFCSAPLLSASNVPMLFYPPCQFMPRFVSPSQQLLPSPMQTPSYAEMASRQPTTKPSTASRQGVVDLESRKYDCLIYIDNSNMFQEGKKFYAQHRNLYVAEDRRFRVRFNEFIDVLIGQRHPLAAKFYFSNPAENAELWDALAQKVTECVHAERFQKNVFGKEKEVDSSITADIVDDLWITESVADRVFVIVSGDSDFLPALKLVLRNGCRAEVYSYTQALASRLKKLEVSYPDRLKIFNVGELLLENDCIFLSYLWHVRSKRNSKSIWIPVRRTMVFKFETSPDEKQIEKVADRCTDLLQFPCMYKKWDSLQFMLVISGSTEELQKRCNFAQAFATVQSAYAHATPKCTVLTAVQFLETVSAEQIAASEFDFGKQNTGSDAASSSSDGDSSEQESDLETIKQARAEPEPINILCENRFWSGPEDDCMPPSCCSTDNASQSDTEPRNDTEDTNSYQVVQHKKTKKKKVRRCKYQFACQNGVHCANEHTDDQCRFFRKHRVGVRYYKSAVCNNRKCEFKSDPVLCPYAHDLLEALCYKCGQRGLHWQANCTRSAK